MTARNAAGTKAEKVKCSDCTAWRKPGRAMSIHRAKSHDDKSRRYRFRTKAKGPWHYTDDPSMSMGNHNKKEKKHERD